MCYGIYINNKLLCPSIDIIDLRKSIISMVHLRWSLITRLCYCSGQSNVNYVPSSRQLCSKGFVLASTDSLAFTWRRPFP